jgi:hypothetical protein
MWVGFGVGFMVIGFAGESVLLVGRGGGWWADGGRGVLRELGGRAFV